MKMRLSTQQQKQQFEDPDLHSFVDWEGSTKDAIDFKKIYFDITEDHQAALLLAQIVYWFLPTKDGSRSTKAKLIINNKIWIVKQRSDWWEEIRLTERQYDRAIQKLLNKRLVEVFVAKSRFHQYQKAHYISLNFKVLNEYITTLTKNCQYYQSVKSTSHQLVKSINTENTKYKEINDQKKEISSTKKGEFSNQKEERRKIGAKEMGDRRIIENKSIKEDPVLDVSSKMCVRDFYTFEKMLYDNVDNNVDNSVRSEVDFMDILSNEDVGSCKTILDDEALNRLLDYCRQVFPEKEYEFVTEFLLGLKNWIGYTQIFLFIKFLVDTYGKDFVICNLNYLFDCKRKGVYGYFTPSFVRASFARNEGEMKVLHRFKEFCLEKFQDEATAKRVYTFYYQVLKVRTKAGARRETATIRRIKNVETLLEELGRYKFLDAMEKFASRVKSGVIAKSDATLEYFTNYALYLKRSEAQKKDTKKDQAPDLVHKQNTKNDPNSFFESDEYMVAPTPIKIDGPMYGRDWRKFQYICKCGQHIIPVREDGSVVKRCPKCNVAFAWFHFAWAPDCTFNHMNDYLEL